MMFMSFISNTTAVTSRGGVANLSGSPLDLDVMRVDRSLVFCVLFCRSLFVLFLLDMVLPVLRFAASDLPYCVYKLFLTNKDRSVYLVEWKVDWIAGCVRSSVNNSMAIIYRNVGRDWYNRDNYFWLRLKDQYGDLGMTDKFSLLLNLQCDYSSWHSTNSYTLWPTENNLWTPL